MHRNFSERFPSVRVHALNSSDSIVSPSVFTTIRSNKGVLKETCVALDSWLTSSFIRRDLCRILGCAGIRKNARLSTLTSPVTRKSLEVLPTLELVDANGKVHTLNDVHVIDNWPFSLADRPI